MLERMYNKGNPWTLLVGIETGAATVKTSTKVSQKTKNSTILKTQQFHYRVYIRKKTETIIQKDALTPKFLAALIIIAEIEKQPKCPSTDDWIKM